MSDKSIAIDFLTNLEGSPPTFICSWITFDIDKQVQISRGWISEKYLAKVANGAVTELYTMIPSGWKSLSLDGLSDKEIYVPQGSNKLYKCDIAGNILQENNLGQFEDLPNDWADLVKHKPWFSQIFLWATKPYGRIVEYSLGADE